MVSVAGTHNLRDWGTDFYLGIGKVKDTNSYKEAKSVIYSPTQTTAIGHSVGSSIANYITSGNDKSIGLVGGYTVRKKARNNSTQYRSNYEIVSALGANYKNMTTFKSPQIRSGLGLVDALKSHNVSNIKKIEF